VQLIRGDKFAGQVTKSRVANWEGGIEKVSLIVIMYMCIVIPIGVLTVTNEDLIWVEKDTICGVVSISQTS
jgi:hypothetical protein